jgi:hypothetical protein
VNTRIKGFFWHRNPSFAEFLDLIISPASVIHLIKPSVIGLPKDGQTQRKIPLILVNSSFNLPSVVFSSGIGALSLQNYFIY